LNRIELAVYNVVKRNPNLKMGIRNVYQRICDIVPVKEADSLYQMHVREGFYFGFHDKCPWSQNNTMLLANRFDIPLRMPRSDDRLTVGYFTGEDQRVFNEISETRAWNWQQGCMLQWVGDTDNVVFNDFDGKSHVAKIYDVCGNLKKTLPVAIGAVSPDGNWALSYSFERCNVYSPGYGYANGCDPEKEVQKPIGHGLKLVDVSSGQVKELFCVKDIATLQPDASMEGAFHYLTHCQFAPSSRRFVFFHRWIKNFNYLRTRMISCDLGGKNLFVFPTDGMVSHVAWRDDRRVFAYARIRQKGDRYVLFEDGNEEFAVVGEKHFNSDGHPSFSPDRRWILTDTYPDRFRVCYLVLYDTQTDRRYNLAKLRSPRAFASPRFETNWHCDLHPRWNRTGDAVCFDSAHTGRRALCTMRVGDLSEEEPKKVD
jgi:WD40 repeat protein